MSNVKILIDIANQPVPKPEPTYSVPDIFQKVSDYIDDVEDGADLDCNQWEYLKSLFLRLHQRNHLGPMEKELLSLVEPVILKFCEFDPGLAHQIDGSRLNRYQGE